MGAVRATQTWAATPRPARLLALAGYLLALLCYVRFVGLPKQTLVGFVWIWLATVAWNARAPWRAHVAFPRDWWPALVVLTLYVYSRGVADQLGFTTVHVREPIEVDRWIFGGTLPTVWLQRHLCGDPCVSTMSPQWYDVALTTVYYSFFFVPVLVASVLWLRNRPAWVDFMRRYLSLNLLGLVVYVTYPMAPPWMAVERGLVPAGVDRITSRGWYDLGETGVHQSVSTLTNQVAAMPSLHAAVALLAAAYGVGRLRSPWRWLLLLYPLAMGVALVYYAEHYVVDVLAGYAATGIVLVGWAVWERGRDPAAPSSTGRRARVRPVPVPVLPPPRAHPRDSQVPAPRTA